MQLTYEGIKQEFKDRLELMSSWSSSLFFGLIERLIDATAYILEKLILIAEFYYNESNLETARTYAGLNRQVRWLSYKPKRKQGAEGNIILSADPTFSDLYTYTGENVIIPRWSEFTNQDEDVFVYATSETIYTKNSIGNHTIAVKEGQVKNYIYTASGIANETISIYGLNIDNDEFEINIVDANENVLFAVNICDKNDNPEKLYFVNDLTNYYCEIINSDDYESTDIKFGDGIYGRKLNVSDKVKITYVETLGNDGNISLPNIITNIKSTLLDSLNNEVTMYVNNTDEISNGNDFEDLEDIRNFAPRLFISGYRAGGEQDWVTLLEAHPYIKKAQVQNASEIGSVNPEDDTKVFVTAVSSDGSALTATQKSEIVLDFKNNNKKSLTEIITWEDPEIIFIKWDIEATVTNLPFTTINATIKNSIEENYGILNVNFSESIYESNYISMLDQLNEIIYHVTNARYLEKNVSVTEVDKEISVGITVGDVEDQILLQENSIELWLRRKIAGVWGEPFRIAYDEAGIFVGEQGDLPSGIYNITDQSITYSSNLISYSIQTILDDPVGYGVADPDEANPTGYILSLAYKTEDAVGNQQRHLRLPIGKYIFDIDTDFIFTTLSYQ